MRRSGFKVMVSLIGLVKPLVLHMIMAISAGLTGHLFATFISVIAIYSLLVILGIISSTSLQVLFIIMIVLALLRGVLRYAEQACNHYIAFKLLAILRDEVFTSLRRLCPAKLEGRDRGDLISLITSDIELLEVFYAHTISPIAIAILFSIIMVSYIGHFNIWLGFIAVVAYLTVGIIIPIYTSKISKENGMNYRNSAGQLASNVLETLNGLSEILQYNYGQQRLEKLSQDTDKLISTEKKMKDIVGKNTALTNTIIFGFDVVMLVVALQVSSFEVAILTVVAFMSSFGPVVALATLGSTLQATFAAGNRVLDIIQEKPLVEEIEDGIDVSFENLKVDNISFKYDKEEILKNVSLDIDKNSIIAVTGKSGSGKSTLLRLLMRFWKVDEGSIEISDTNINKINTKSLRNIESFVTQDTHLFHDTIKNNLKIAKLDASDNEIYEACKKASIHEFIMKLPMGYDTEVTQLGESLSAGEKQRIGLARAFLHNAPVMLLDEPTSNLDKLNEAIILKSLYEEREGKTIVLVSHRSSTLNICDHKICVENGRVS